MFLSPKSKSSLEVAIDDAVFKMQVLPADSDEYGVILDRVKVLQKLKADEKPNRPSADTMILAATNLVGIAMILRHEQLNVITSKALGFVPKLK